MTRALWLRFFVLSVLFALIMAVVFVAALRQLIGRPSEEIQRNLYRFYAQIVEEQPYQPSIDRALRLRWQDPPMPIELWVVDASSRVLAGVDGAPPAALLALPRPAAIHASHAQRRAMLGEPGMAVIRLNSASPAWLLIRHHGAARGGMMGFAALFIGSLVCATFFGLFMVLLYLRGRAAQARSVIAELQAGRLGARFRVSPLDAAGGLMQHFNRMAEQIESLVARLASTERTRRELLQELGHDLRTPLTSVRTAADTLAMHGEAMGAAERAEFHALIACEAAYLGRLVEDLFFIADIEAPAGRSFSQLVDLAELARAECRVPRRIAATFGGAAPPIEGDAYLLARLLRNLFENAARHGRSAVHAELAVEGAQAVLRIEDDGPGMSALQMAQFGKRRSQRVSADAGQPGVSLGLGSVIAVRIAALHGAVLSLARGGQAGGTCVILRFPLPQGAA